MQQNSVIDETILSSKTAVALLEAGIDQFGQYGLKATTRNVAERASANIAAIPYYFKNKQGLYLACMHYIVDNIWRDLGPQLNQLLCLEEPLPPQSAKEHFLDSIEGFCGYFLEGEDTVRWAQFIMREHATPTQAYDIFYERYYQHVQRLQNKLWAQCLRLESSEAKVIIQCHAIFGQALAFLVAKESLLRGLKCASLSPDQVALARETVRENVAAMLVGLSKPVR